ncbi:MAG: TraB/GumN family protein [Bacteroidota bacterium]|nr:TraB/GumN family protein [Bacteroidota bacterium]
MRKICVILVAVPFLFLAQSAKKYPSLLWKISGNGLKKPSYLYGTMHVSNRVAYHLSEQFFEALKSVEVVGLETNPGDWLQNMEKTGELSQANQFTNYYNSDFYKTSFSIKFPEKKSFQGILSYDPDIIDGLLYRRNRSKENFEENTYIDLFIFQSASKLGKQLISLEDFAQSEIKAKLSALPDKDTGNDEEGTNYKNYYSNFQKIEDAYRDGNLDVIDSLSKLTSSKNTQKYLINDRNVFFVNTMDSVLKTKTLFSGVGAAHLPGKDGVIELLRKKGYTVEPIIPKITKKSDLTRDELDLMVKPVTFQKNFVSDSIFSVNLPGKLSQIVNLDNLKYYINADMVNGSFYTIVRLKTYCPLAKTTPQQLQAKVDSLLFENIPGKIISKKEIVSNNGLKGIEVINKTRRGDQQHYQIYFSDMELFMFKLGGKLEYATGNEAKQFFNSIQFYNKTEGSVQFIPKTKGFTVKIPGNYTYSKNEGSSQKGLVEDLYAYSKTQKQFYGIKQAVYNDFNYLEEDTFELNQLAKNCLHNFEFKKSITYKIQQQQGFPSIVFTAKNKTDNYFYGKITIKGAHYYLQYLVSETEASFDNEFFNSFKLIDFEHVNTLKEITDKSYSFKARDEVTENAFSRFNEAYLKAYNEAVLNKKDKKNNKDYDFKTSNKVYYSPSSNEYINITFEKYNDYDYRNLKEMDSKIAKSIKNTTSMLMCKKSFTNSEGVYTYTFTLKDTATSRAINTKIIFKNGTMYDISTPPYDTVIGLKGWTKDFFETFRPTDTVIGKNVFEDKYQLLLNDLCSNDTVARQRANNSLVNSVSMQKEFTNDFLKFIQSDRLSLVNDDSRAQLFVNGGTIENEKIIEPYKKLYKQYTDSFYLQLCLLKGLTYLKTPASYNAFLNLITNETPLVGNENTVNDVFTVLNDSLELCKNFFPAIYSLTKYEEYKSAVYNLLTNLIEKKLISVSTYSLQKDNILADANLALKRYNASGNKVVNTANNDYSNFDHLDKTAKELAENIQASIQGLTNNNFNKSAKNNKEIATKPELVNYAVILSAFYKTDEKTKQFFAKLSKLKSQSITMPVAILLLKQNIILNDTLIQFYCKNKYTRTYFYSELEKEKLLLHFDKKYLSQKSLIESVISSQRQITNMYSYDKDKTKTDSIMFFKELEAKNKYQVGKIYVYKVPKTKNDDEKWAVVFIKDNKQAITSEIEVLNVNYFVDKDKTEDENINEMLDDFYLSFRYRAAGKTNYPYNDYE